MSVNERAFVFGCAGEELIGVVGDAAARADTGVLIVVGGWQYRIGSHRQFLLLARALASRGIPTMRFDYRGMGDSSGEMRTFTDITADIGCAIDAFHAHCPNVRRVVLWGLCDAASASLMYWHETRDTRVAGMAMFNPWVLSEVALARSQVRHHYLRRIFELEFWGKLVRGQVDVRDALGVAARAWRRTARSEENGTYQDAMAAALASFDGRVLLVLSGRDPTAKGFVEYCGAHPRWRGLLEAGNVEQRHLEDADHTFSSAALRHEVEAITADWFERAFSGGSRPAVL